MTLFELRRKIDEALLEADQEAKVIIWNGVKERFNPVTEVVVLPSGEVEIA